MKLIKEIFWYWKDIVRSICFWYEDKAHDTIVYFKNGNNKRFSFCSHETDIWILKYRQCRIMRYNIPGAYFCSLKFKPIATFNLADIDHVDTVPLGLKGRILVTLHLLKMFFTNYIFCFLYIIKITVKCARRQTT